MPKNKSTSSTRVKASDPGPQALRKRVIDLITGGITNPDEFPAACHIYKPLEPLWEVYGDRWKDKACNFYKKFIKEELAARGRKYNQLLFSMLFMSWWSHTNIDDFIDV